MRNRKNEGKKNKKILAAVHFDKFHRFPGRFVLHVFGRYSAHGPFVCFHFLLVFFPLPLSSICRLCLAKLLIVYFHFIFACNWTLSCRSYFGYRLPIIVYDVQWLAVDNFWRRWWATQTPVTISIDVCLSELMFCEKFLLQFTVADDDNDESEPKEKTKRNAFK